MSSPRTLRLLAATLVLLVTSLALGSTMPESARAHAADGHPARIHEGSCTATGPAADKLTGVGATVSLEGTPIPEATVQGAETATPLDVERDHCRRFVGPFDQPTACHRRL